MAALKDFAARRATFAVKRRIRLYEKMGRFTRNGMALPTALRKLGDRYVKTRDLRADLFKRMTLRIEEGDQISAIMGRYIPPGERLLIQSGEESGKVHEGFFEAKNLAETMRELRGTLKAQLAYPTVLAVLLCVMLALVALKLVPVLESAVPYAKWPAYSTFLKTLSSGVITFGPLIVLMLGVFLFIAIRTLPTWRGPLRENLDRWAPPWTIYREVQGSAFLIALAALAQSGKAVSAAVELLGAHGSPWLQVHVKRMLRTIMAGGSPGEAMRTGLFAREVEDDIEDFSSTANFEDALARVGQDQTRDAIERIKARAAVVQGVVLVLVAVTLLYVYSAAILVAVNVASEAMTMAR